MSSPDERGSPESVQLSIVIPAHNERDVIATTLTSLYEVLLREDISHEVLVVNDHCGDGTQAVLNALASRVPTMRCLENDGPGGFGWAVRYGLARCEGECVAIMMADGSDAPEDLVRFYRELCARDLDAVFGTRFSRGGSVADYPPLKLALNRMANLLIQALFRIRYDDVTNAFKLYRRATLRGLEPLLSPHFNLTVELPLKTIVRGYSYDWLPNSWRDRAGGTSKFAIKEMGSRYLFIIFYCLVEKHFSRGDYRKSP